MTSYHIHFVPGMSIAQVEKQVIQHTLRFFNGNKTQSARALDISIRTLESRMKDYGEDAKQREERAESAKHDHAIFLDRQRNGSKADPKRAVNDQKAKEVQAEASADELKRAEEFLNKCRNGNVSQSQDADEEPAQGSAKERPVPLREREEVQDVLPEESAGLRARA